MREQGIPLENGIDPAPVCRQGIDPAAVKKDIPVIGFNEAADDAQRRGLAAAGRPQQGHEFSVADVQIQMIEHRFPVK